jgi:hypothetical protein
MGPRSMDVVVEGKRYRTATATLLATGPGWDQRLGDEPRRLLEVRVGGVDLSAVVGGRGWERLGWQAFLFRTTKGNHFVQFQSTWPGERDQLLPLSPDESMQLYGELPEKRASSPSRGRSACGRRLLRRRGKLLDHARQYALGELMPGVATP